TIQMVNRCLDLRILQELAGPEHKAESAAATLKCHRSSSLFGSRQATAECAEMEAQNRSGKDPVEPLIVILSFYLPPPGTGYFSIGARIFPAPARCSKLPATARSRPATGSPAGTSSKWACWEPWACPWPTTPPYAPPAPLPFGATRNPVS